MRATQAIIHLDNLQHNILQIKNLIGENVKICLPVKADAYGHNAIRVAIAGIRAGVSSLAVASIPEAIELRNAGVVAPIISLSIPVLDEIFDIVEYDIHPLVFDTAFIDALNKEAGRRKKTAGVHLKIDTGMSRIGCTADEAVNLAEKIQNAKNLKLHGTATHFSASESLTKADIEFTKKQISLFMSAVQKMRNAGLKHGLLHAANSGAVLQYPQAHFDMVRPGIIVYGYPPSSLLKDIIDLKPVMSLITKVVSIKKIKAGDAVSYNRQWIAQRDTYIGTLPIGYADGLNRRLSPGLKVKIGDEFFPIVGRICMDQCMVDLGTAPNVKRWDDVVIFGESKDGNTACDLSDIAGTIHYEITCNINKRVPRIFTNEIIS
ncbi:MAG: alanine racemase [Treponema sp.]|nr:MAG: alanine racemase [Treponema sp.]